ncbi:MAG: NAD(P)H-flavin reductase [Gammaproteobacteria bacterium]|nr:NAD(P)H-flavin reductase [Gammaproteobacteria bacterium]
MKPLKAQVAAITAVSDDTWRVLLRPPVIERIAFAAGQYLFLVMPDGGKRAFSIASAPECRETIELHIRATPGHDAALAVMEHLRGSACAELELPHGRCVLRPGTRPIILLAGGTGFAPMKALVESALARGEARSMQLYRGAHSLDHLYLRELTRDWAARAPWFRCTEVMSGEEPGWTGRRGLVHQAVLADHPDLSGFDVYASGRPEMVDTAYAAFQAQGLPADRFFSDMLDLKA